MSNEVIQAIGLLASIVAGNILVLIIIGEAFRHLRKFARKQRRKY